MKKGDFVRLNAGSVGFFKHENLDPWICDIPSNTLVLYVDQNLKNPDIHKVIYQDQVGWIYASSEVLVRSESHAETKKQTETGAVVSGRR